MMLRFIAIRSATKASRPSWKPMVSRIEDKIKD